MRTVPPIRHSDRSRPFSLPGTGDLLREPDEILAKKCSDKCSGLARCSPANSTTCGDVNICRRHTCSGHAPAGGCYPRFECESHTCTGVAISPSITAMPGSEDARLRQRLAAHLAQRPIRPS